MELGGKTCKDQSLFTGNLKCAADCKSFDTAGCTCGNGKLDGDELCDGNFDPGRPLLRDRRLQRWRAALQARLHLRHVALRRRQRRLAAPINLSLQSLQSQATVFLAGKSLQVSYMVLQIAATQRQVRSLSQPGGRA